MNRLVVPLALSLMTSVLPLANAQVPELPSLSALDRDDDGRVSRAEMEAALTELTKDRFEKLDADNNHGLSRVELQVAQDQARSVQGRPSA